jgi:two-component system CheB/CheR fusion protein
MARTKRNGGSPPPETETSATAVVPVVGVGASAGGLNALEALLPAITSDSGLAFVIVQHLDPDHESSLAQLLRRLSPLPVSLIHNATPIEPNNLYVIPPNASLTLVDDRLLLAPPLEHRGQRTPIDGFFLSLAEARGDKAAGIILSGSGSDGTLGLRAIKEHGGLTIAQDGAEYDGMMRSAVRSGMVDFVLPLDQIPAKLADYFHHLDGHRQRQAESGDAADHLTQICALLRTRTGHDFSGYKDKTVARRVQRRMQVLQIDTVPEFIDRLRKEPAEVDTLLQDLLIGVTNFFRDPQAFAALEEKVIPQLFEGKGPDDTVRVWVPGCSTGEEAYSIAILLREHMPKGSGAPKLQIFASDIDEPALAVARIGRYPATIARDIPQNRLERYFVREDGTYRIASDLRELCLFSAHNLLRDAPFSKLDLVTCRNLLIYLTPELQNRLIPLFHYALNEGGTLFLGSSENLTRHTRLFSTLDKPHRIFRRRTQIERRLPEFPLTAPEGLRRKTPVVPRVATDQEPLQALAERQLLDRYSPAYVIINAEGDVLHGSARTGKYLELSAGVPKIDIFSMGRQGLRPDLRAGVHKAIASGQVVVQKNVVVGTNGGRQLIDLVIQPLRTSAVHDPLYLVVFQDIGGIKSHQEAEVLHDDDDGDDLENANLRQIEMELRATKERLQTTTEELESAGGAAVDQRGAADRQRRAERESRGAFPRQLRHRQPAREHADRHRVPRPQPQRQELHPGGQGRVPPGRERHRPADHPCARPLRGRHRAGRCRAGDAHARHHRAADREHRFGRALRHAHDALPHGRQRDRGRGHHLRRRDQDERGRGAHQRTDSRPARSHPEPRDAARRRAGRHPDPARRRPGRRGAGQPLRRAAAGRRHARRRRWAAAAQPRDPPVPGRPRAWARRASAAARHPHRPAGAQLRGPAAARRRRAAGRHDHSTPLFEQGGKVRGAIAAIGDISERKNAEARQQVLLYELQHRVKNIIATISALAGRTLRADISPAEFVQAFQGRMRGMARTHELLSRSNWAGAPIGELVESTLRSLVSREPGAFSAQGPEVRLTPNAAATLGMVIYELATNATKYGALSQPSGRLDVTWKLVGPTQGGRVELTWTESGGREVPLDLTPGFGLNFITRSIEYEMQGKAEREPAPGGLRWTVEFPAAQSVQRT